MYNLWTPQNLDLPLPEIKLPTYDSVGWLEWEKQEAMGTTAVNTGDEGVPNRVFDRSISLWSFPLCAEAEWIAPSSLFPEHSVHPSSIVITMFYDSCLHSLSTPVLVIFLCFISNTQHRMNTFWLILNCYFALMICNDCHWLYVMKRRP